MQLQLRVTAIAETAVVRVFAATPRDGFGLGDFCFQRRETRAFMRAVAKRLRL